MARRVLFIYNDPTAPEAMLGTTFADQGFDIDTCTGPAEVPAYPDPLNYDVVVPLGSRFGAHDPAHGAWVDPQMALVRHAVDAGVGVLGVCFGGQLVAQALGGTVGPSPSPELGWYTVDSQVPFLSAGPWFQWHSDRWALPAGAVEIARNDNASQAFLSGSALALQFHPELDPPLLELWLAEDSDGDVARSGIDVDALRTRTGAERDAAAVRLTTLVTGFLTHLGDLATGRVAR